MKAHEEEHVEYSILSDRLNIPAVVSRIMDHIREKTQATGCACLFEMKVVLNELISNAVIHGNMEDPKRPVDIRISYKKDKIEFEVTDRGVAFKPESRGNPEVLCETGRGVSICTVLCRKLEYSFKKGIGNSAKAVFYITAE